MFSLMDRHLMVMAPNGNFSQYEKSRNLRRVRTRELKCLLRFTGEFWRQHSCPTINDNAVTCSHYRNPAVPIYSSKLLCFGAQHSTHSETHHEFAEHA